MQGRMARPNLQLFVLILVLAFSSWGLAKPNSKSKAKESSSEASSEYNPLEAIKDLNNQSADFYDFLMRYQGQFVPKQELQKQIEALRIATEAYLNKLGVQFQIEKRSMKDAQFEGAAIQKIDFPAFVLQSVHEGSGFVDQNAEFLRLILADPAMAKTRLILNPYLQVENSRIQGFFEKETRRIEFSVPALSYRVGGLGDTLRHEFRHAQEQFQLEQGRPTLASWVFKNSSSQVSEATAPYSEFLRLDEIDTHRLDVEYLTETAPGFEKYNLDKSKLVELRRFRSSTLDFKKQILSRLETDTRLVFWKLADLNFKNLIQWQCLSQELMMVCQAKLDKGMPYQTVELTLPIQLLQTQNAQIPTEQIQHAIEWALSQI